jgi:transcriptional regulator with XRE-family HTH domain
MNGEQLKNFARNRGYSNKRLADALGITPQNLSQLLAKDDIRTGFLERVADAIGTTPAEIYGGNVTASASGNGKAVGVGSINDSGLLEKALEQNNRLLAIIEDLNRK